MTSTSDQAEDILRCITFEQDFCRDLRYVVADKREQFWNGAYLKELSECWKGELIYSRQYPERQFAFTDRYVAKKIELREIVLLGSSQDGLYLEKGIPLFPDGPENVNETDTDILMVFSGLPIYQAQTKHEEFPFLVVRDGLDYPGYVKLEVIDGTNRNTPCFLDPLLLKKKLVSCLEIGDFYIHQQQDLIGPAITGNIEDNTGIHELDFVACLHMTEWPKAADSFITRERDSSWPTSSMIQEAIKHGCGFVAVGHTESKTRNLEWRLSFSKTEKMLIRSFTDVQVRVYLFFKTLFKVYFSEPECLSSYMVKTVFLWFMELVSQDQWAEGNILECLEMALDQLECCIRHKCIPNYFVPANNMLKHKDQHILTEIQRKITVIQENILGSIWNCAKSKSFAGLVDISLVLLQERMLYMTTEKAQWLLAMCYFTKYLHFRLLAHRYCNKLSKETYAICLSRKCNSILNTVPKAAVRYLLNTIRVLPDTFLICVTKTGDGWSLDTSCIRSNVVKFIRSNMYIGPLVRVINDQEFITNKKINHLPVFEELLDWADVTSQWSGMEPLNPKYITNHLEEKKKL